MNQKTTKSAKRDTMPQAARNPRSGPATDRQSSRRVIRQKAHKAAPARHRSTIASYPTQSVNYLIARKRKEHQ